MRFVHLAAATALVLAPGAALAQAGSTTEGAPKATDLHGSPNASGYGKDTGMEKGSTVIGGAGSSEEKSPSADKMHGSPNASGYQK